MLQAWITWKKLTLTRLLSERLLSERSSLLESCFWRAGGCISHGGWVKQICSIAPLVGIAWNHLQYQKKKKSTDRRYYHSNWNTWQTLNTDIKIQNPQELILNITNESHYQAWSRNDLLCTLSLWGAMF